MKSKTLFPITALASVVLVGLASCRHYAPDGPFDDGSGVVTPEPEPEPCDTNTIWFQQQVLPILASSCTNPGEGLNCHHTAVDDNDGIRITSYETLMASDILELNDPFNSDFWETITTSDPNDRMPPPPQNPLTPDQRDIISQWLQQGAQNNSCENAGCDTLTVTYQGTILPIVQQRCMSCHSGGSPGGNLDFSTWGDLQATALDGTLEASIKRWAPPAKPMPPTLALSDCRISQFMIWIEGGAQP